MTDTYLKTDLLSNKGEVGLWIFAWKKQSRQATLNFSRFVNEFAQDLFDYQSQWFV